jgi:hypothetical protein
MTRVIHSAANFGDTAFDAAGSLIVHNHDCFDGVALVGFETCFDVIGIDSTSPVSRHKLDLEAHPFGEIFPQSRKLPRLECKDAVAGRKRIDDGCFPSSGT